MRSKHVLFGRAQLRSDGCFDEVRVYCLCGCLLPPMGWNANLLIFHLQRGRSQPCRQSCPKWLRCPPACVPLEPQPRRPSTCELLLVKNVACDSWDASVGSREGCLLGICIRTHFSSKIRFLRFVPISQMKNQHEFPAASLSDYLLRESCSRSIEACAACP